MRQRLANIFEIGSEATRSSRNLPMEGLRGFAVFLVFFAHYHASFHPWVTADAFSSWTSQFLENISHTGVDFFFVLSGYLIYGAIIKKQRPFFDFIRRRAQRIYPTFLIVLAIYLVLSALDPSRNKIPADPVTGTLYVVANALLLPGVLAIDPIITVSWSLSYELFYYLSIPVLVGLLAMRDWRPGKRVVFFLALTVLYVTYCVIGPHPRIEMIMFVSGILMYEARHSYGLAERFNRRSDIWVIGLFIATLPVIYALNWHPKMFGALPGVVRFGETYRISLLFITFLIFMLASVSGKSILSRVFTWAPMRWLGNMSYSYYLIHGLVVQGVALVMLRLFPPDGHQTLVFWLTVPLIFVTTTMAGAVLFILVERRFSLAANASKPERETVTVPRVATKRLVILEVPTNVEDSQPELEPAAPLVAARD